MIVKLLTEHHLEFLGLKGDCRGSSESTLVKMSNSCKSHAAAQFYKLNIKKYFWSENATLTDQPIVTPALNTLYNPILSAYVYPIIK